MTAAPPAPAAVQALGRTTDGRPLPPARRRATGRRPDSPVLGWVASIALALLALGLRLWRLGRPHDFEFDETYYAKDAWSMLNHGYVQGYVDKADRAILDGRVTGQWDGDPSMIVHPEVGKWMIAAGEWVFGMDPFGWRVSAAVVGSLMVLVTVRLGRRLTGSTMLGLVAGVLVAFDGLHLVLSRLALLDVFAAFWLLLAVHLLVMDRDWFRRRATRVAARSGVGGWGPVRAVLLRPWLVLSGVTWGLAIGTKWTPVYALAAFGLMVWVWSAGARRSLGVRSPVLRSAVVDGIPAFVQLVGVALVVYTVSWAGWLVHAEQYEEHLSSTQYTGFDSWSGQCNGEDMTGVRSTDERTWPTATEPDASGIAEVGQSLRSLWYYHADVLTFHSYFLDCSDHTYASAPSGWLLLNRPVGVDAQLEIKPGEQGCDAPADSECLRQVLLLGNPVLWWGSLLALAASAYFWLGARDWRFGVPLVGVASTWLPWLLYDDRPIFSFYAILCLPFLALACALVLGKMLGPDGTGPRRTAAVVAGGSFVVLVLLAFAWFWPVWTDQLLTKQEWVDRMWFERWI